jgi:outer membrane protein
MHSSGKLLRLSRRVLMTGALSLLLAAPVSFAAQGPEKVGVVDSGKIIQQMPETKQAEATLQSTAAPYQKELDRLSQDYQKSVAAYKQQAASMTKAARDQKEKELNTKGQALDKYQQEKFGRNGILEKKQQELLTPIRNKALAAVQTIAQKEGYSLVIEKSVMVYGSPDNDLTFKVLNQLNIK